MGLPIHKLVSCFVVLDSAVMSLFGCDVVMTPEGLEGISNDVGNGGYGSGSACGNTIMTLVGSRRDVILVPRMSVGGSRGWVHFGQT